MRESNVLIIDEAHDFEQVLSDFISINLSESQLKNLHFKNFKSIGKSIKMINNIEDFVDFVDKLKEEISDTKSNLKQEIFKSGLGKKGDQRELRLGKLLGKSGDSVKLMKKFADVETLETKLTNFTDDFMKRPENWILEYSFTDKKEKKISIQPVWAAPYLDEYVWSKYDHVILMSGTIVNKKLFAYINGIPEALACYYSIDSPFNVKNRPIYYMPVSRMTYKNKENAFKQYKPFVEKLMEKYKTKKGIFHTVTYEIADWVRDTVRDERFIFHGSDSKDKALKKHYELEEEATV
jgi:Rad3-related DNA helicase